MDVETRPRPKIAEREVRGVRPWRHRNCAEGACEEALEWEEAEPRTWCEVSVKGLGWYGRHAATPEQISACIEGTDAAKSPHRKAPGRPGNPATAPAR